MRLGVAVRVSVTNNTPGMIPAVVSTPASIRTARNHTPPAEKDRYVMSESPLEDVVSKQYEEWIYPDPIQDLTSWAQNNWQWFDPSHAFKVLWPEKTPRTGLDILIAGCGTNQAAVFAYNNPESRITAIDVSTTSLEHTEYLKNRHGLDNLTVQRLPIEEVGALGKDFDLIVTTGVLHHLVDPQAGMNALAPLLRKDGVMAVMLYATFGRQGVEMMQDVFRELGLGQSNSSIKTVREAIALLPDNHPVRSYLNIAPDLNFDAGVVDTFLHGRDCDYTVAECIELVENGGLAFQDMFMRSSYYPAPRKDTNGFLRSVEELPREKLWGVMERINFSNACHFFLATHPDRAPENYVLDFSTTDCLRYVPMFRYRCGADRSGVYRGLSQDANGNTRWSWALNIDDLEAELVLMIDGRRSIGEIAEAVYARKDDLGIGVNRVEIERQIRRMFQTLWRLDFITVDLSASAAPAKKAVAEKAAPAKAAPAKKAVAKKAPAKKAVAK